MKLDKKTELDKLIHQINTKFKINNFSSFDFTGQNYTDNAFINNMDPNYYRDINYINKNFYNTNKINFPLYKEDNSEKKSNTLEEENDVKIFSESINIELEINNINDILNIINCYPYNPSIKYNINLKILHDIKEPLEELNNMIGMNDLKINIVDQILYFIQELHKNKGTKTNGDFMHTVIYGPPGTGKTEIAQIMGKIYSKIGILSKGSFKKVTRSDLIAGYLGQTALKTRDAIKDALGGVLFIDEAYSLGDDSFSKECIDTLCEALSDHKDDLMVIVAGYEKELNETFFKINSGMPSRFIWRFSIESYTPKEMKQIFEKQVVDNGWKIKEDFQLKEIWFTKHKDTFLHYGRDMEILFSYVKISHAQRIFGKEKSEKKKITEDDLENGFKLFIQHKDISKPILTSLYSMYV
jgi:SpoVK/Ycf46/Vps4 family AAA+-type ATPase